MPMPKQPRIKNARKSTKPKPLPVTTELGTFCKSSKFWYADGNIILQAENTQFKVHQCVLSRQSSVFEDMFLIPQPADHQSGECPVVALLDSVEDWEVLLTLLYDALSIFKRQFNGDMPYPVIASMLRLGKKYNFKHIGAQAIMCLKEHFSDTLCFSDLNFFVNNDRFAGTIAIAQENSLLSILSTAYWQLLMKYDTVEEIVSLFSNLDPDKKAKLRRNEPTDTLIGRENIRAVADQYSLSFVRDKSLPCQGCESQDHCSKILDAVVLEVDEKTVNYALRPGYSQSIFKQFCHPCELYVNYLHNQGRQNLWRDFAEHFGLKSDHNLWDGEKDF